MLAGRLRVLQHWASWFIFPAVCLKYPWMVAHVLLSLLVHKRLYETGIFRNVIYSSEDISVEGSAPSNTANHDFISISQFRDLYTRKM